VRTMQQSLGTRLSLENQVAIVTGAASGIGRATALALAGAGAGIALIDRDEHGLNKSADLIREAGGKSTSFPFDLFNWKDIPSLVAAVLAKSGRVDILINAAGISDDGKGMFEVDSDLWERVHTIDLRSPFILMQQVARHMIDRGGGGKIVNISSTSAFRADVSAPPAYGSAKAGLNALTRSAAAALGQHNINVNAVVPGATETPMIARFDRRGIKEGPLSNLLQRVSEPEDVANAILFLCLPASRQITGQMIHTSAGNVV